MIKIRIIIIVILTGFLIYSGCRVNVDHKEIKNIPSGIDIRKTSDGFEIYRGNELLLEMTSRNTDSLSLETLNYIYEVSKEKPEEMEDNKKEVKDETITQIIKNKIRGKQ